MDQPRERGKFILKGNEERKVRTVRLTDTTWNKLEKITQKRCITRTELIEELLEQDNKEVIKLLEEALKLKPNAGGAIKEKIREVLRLLTKN